MKSHRFGVRIVARDAHPLLALVVAGASKEEAFGQERAPRAVVDDAVVEDECSSLHPAVRRVLSSREFRKAPLEERYLDERHRHHRGRFCHAVVAVPENGAAFSHLDAHDHIVAESQFARRCALRHNEVLDRVAQSTDQHGASTDRIGPRRAWGFPKDDVVAQDARVSGRD